MSVRELAILRDLVARVRLARVAVSAAEAPSWPRLGPVCVYCGRRTGARTILACRDHRDILDVDPKYDGRVFLHGRELEVAA